MCMFVRWDTLLLTWSSYVLCNVQLKLTSWPENATSCPKVATSCLEGYYFLFKRMLFPLWDWHYFHSHQLVSWSWAFLSERTQGSPSSHSVPQESFRTASSETYTSIPSTHHLVIQLLLWAHLLIMFYTFSYGGIIVSNECTLTFPPPMEHWVPQNTVWKSLG